MHIWKETVPIAAQQKDSIMFGLSPHRKVGRKPRFYALSACLRLMVGCALVAATAAQAELSTPQHKLQISDPALGAQLIQQGAKPVADYGAFQIFDVPQLATGLERRADVEVRDEYNLILLNATTLDTSQAQTQAARAEVGNFQGKRMHLLQFAGPVQPAWRESLMQAGVQLVTYVPQNAYLVYGDAKAIAQVQALAAAPHVQWEGAYLDSYKLDPDARPVDAQGNPREIGTDEFAVQLVADPAANASTLRLLDQLKQAPFTKQHYVLNFLNVIVRLAPESLARLAAQPDVVSIQPYFTPRKFCEHQAQIIAGNLNGNVPSGPGYLAWLASKGFTQAQFDSSGFAIDLSDSGIDTGTTTPNHFGLYVGGNLTAASRVVYNRLAGSPNPGSTLEGCGDGHGTINSHIIIGYNDLSGFPHADASGYHYDLGICPFVRIGSSVIFDPDTFTNPDYTDLQSKAYNSGARVSNNSWGGGQAGRYNIQAQEYDALVRDAQPDGSAFPTPGNQEMVIVFAAGNSGPGSRTVHPPGSGKNVFTVGAAKNVNPFGMADACGWPDSFADIANDVVSFSSRGPCSDGRFKPDITAPGTHVIGGVYQVTNPPPTGQAQPCFTGCSGTPAYFPAGQQWYTSSSGTSQATPAVAGACALLRQYFINQALTPPSPAMTKAYLVNAARYMTGVAANDTLPSNSQGMGELDLAPAFDGTPSALRDELAADLFTASGQTRTFVGKIVDSTKPFRVTLAWTDAPGNTTGNAYNNNLDLVVTVGGITYKGNVFAGAYSTPGGSADTKDNLESVFLPSGISGVFTVTVIAANINSDGVPNNAFALDQDFALVIYNSKLGNPPTISGQPTNVSAIVGQDITFTVRASGDSPLHYQWSKDGRIILGATQPVYNLHNAQISDSGAYAVLISNDFGSVNSSNALVNVLPRLPIIVTQPADQTVLVGSPASFSVSALGAAPLNYQWLLNGQPISGATDSTYSLIRTRVADAGSYAVQITNPFGSIQSSNAVLSPLLLSAFGDNSLGQVQIAAAAANIVAIAAGSWHSLALRADGTVVAWGEDYAGQCDVPAGLTGVAGIAAGGYHSLARLTNGTVIAWGANDDGQSSPPAGLGPVKGLAAGTWHSLALRADGSVVAWGDNSWGQSTVPAGLSNIIAVAAGGNHSLALRADGSVVAWGQNSDAAGSYVGQSSVPWDLNNVVAIGAGGYHSLAVKADGTVELWGDNSRGQSAAPADLFNVVAVAGGSSHSLALRTDGTVVAWGNDDNGQCNIPAGLANAAAIAAGDAHSLILVSDAQPIPRLFNPSRSGSQFSVLLKTVLGSNYELEYKDALSATNWTALPSVQGTGAVQTLSDPNASGPQRFYRVRQW